MYFKPQRLYGSRVLTFFASFRSLRCLLAEAFSILWRKRTGTRFDLGSEKLSAKLPKG